MRWRGERKCLKVKKANWLLNAKCTWKVEMFPGKWDEHREEHIREKKIRRGEKIDSAERVDKAEKRDSDENRNI